MAAMSRTLLDDIREFLRRTGMGASYFGKVAVGNSELVKRLESGKRVWPETEVKARAFMMTREKVQPAKRRVAA